MEAVFAPAIPSRRDKAKRGLDAFFSPKSVAVMGATEKAGRAKPCYSSDDYLAKLYRAAGTGVILEKTHRNQRVDLGK